MPARSSPAPSVQRPSRPSSTVTTSAPEAARAVGDAPGRGERDLVLARTAAREHGDPAAQGVPEPVGVLAPVGGVEAGVVPVVVVPVVVAGRGRAARGRAGRGRAGRRRAGRRGRAAVERRRRRGCRGVGRARRCRRGGGRRRRRRRRDEVADGDRHRRALRQLAARRILREHEAVLGRVGDVLRDDRDGEPGLLEELGRRAPVVLGDVRDERRAAAPSNRQGHGRVDGARSCRRPASARRPGRPAPRSGPRCASP